MLAYPQPPRIHLPKGWQDGVKLAVLHAIALAHYARGQITHAATVEFSGTKIVRERSCPQVTVSVME